MPLITSPPFLLSPTTIILFIEFTYYNNHFSKEATQHKHTTSKQFNNKDGWGPPFSRLLLESQGSSTILPFPSLIFSHIPMSSIQKPMQDVQNHAIKYLTYLILNKRKLDKNASSYTSY